MADKGTEQATPQRKQKAHDDGDFVRSRELLSAVAMLGGVLVIGAATGPFVRIWMRVYIDTLAGLRNSDLTGDGAIEIIRRTMVPGLAPVALVMAAAFVGSLLMGLLQGGGIGFHAKSIAFNFDRLNPVTNVDHLFSLRSTTRVVKSLVPAGVMVIFGWFALHGLLVRSPVMSMMRLPQTFSTAYGLALDAAWVSLLWSGFDYAIEWRAWNERLKMTKQEIREEMRDATGNPQIKARVRQIQRAMRRRRVKTDMSRASVLITNPTHYAVALEFSFETMQAPTVLAKGRDLHALEMREESRWAGVPIIENPPLARSLYQAVDPGSAIPFVLYQAVAGILAFLYRQKVEEKMRVDQAAKRTRTAESQRFHAAPNYPTSDFITGRTLEIDRMLLDAMDEHLSDEVPQVMGVDVPGPQVSDELPGKEVPDKDAPVDGADPDGLAATGPRDSGPDDDGLHDNGGDQ